jgi:uncharacterized protein YegP (UPF0339 family)
MARNGETIVQSEVYASKASTKNGIAPSGSAATADRRSRQVEYD